MRSSITLGIGLLIVATAPGVRAGNSVADQAGQTAQQAAKPGAPAPAKPGTPAAAKPATQAPAKPASQTPTKPAAQAPAKPAGQMPAKPATTAATKPSPQAAKPAAPAAKPVAAAAKAAAKPTAKPNSKPGRKKGASKPPVEKAPKAAAESEVKAARRDPFESMLAHSQGKANPNLPPGKAGLQVSTLRLDGIVRAPNGMIAVVSNPQSRTYFLREGDHLYDGSVEKITMDGVSFHEEGKDAFGKPMERQVNKRIYSTSSGEQQ